MTRNACRLAARIAPLWLLCLASAQTGRDRPPNLLVITIDTLRADRLECYGYKNGRTPRINGLAADGVLVENAYTPIPLTLPSHASLFTGTYPMFHGVRDFTGFTLAKDRTTLATMLKRAGYKTGAVVGSAVLEARWGLNQGFDTYYDNFPFSLYRDWQPIAERRGDIVVREGLSWLDKNKRDPFFLWLHLFDPHDPFEPPPPYDRVYRERPYDGEIAYTDENVGKVIDYLKKNDLYDHCLIVLLADHGESLGEHGEKYHGFFIYDATLRIPMIFKLPSALGARGRRLVEAVRTIDVLPTTLQILGLTDRVRATELQGRGIYGSLIGKGGQGSLDSYAELFLPYYHFDWSPLLSIRRGRYKLIEAPRPELYDTVADPGETRNLYAQEQAIAGQLRELLRQTASRYSPRSGAPSVPSDIDPATMEKLQSLGYLAMSSGKSGLPADRSLPDPKEKIEVYELIREGTRAAQQKNFDRAVRDLAEAVRREPQSLIARFQLANVYRVTGAHESAEREFLKTLELKPDHPLAHRRLAEIYLASKRYREAESAYKKVLAQSPNDFLAHFNLGGLYVMQDRWDEALAAFRSAQASNRNDARVPLIVGRILLQRSDPSGALEAALQAVKLDPSLIEAHMTAMEAYRMLGMAGKAAETARIIERLKTKP